MMAHDSDLAEKYKAEGNAAFKKEQYSTAVIEYTKAISADSSSAVYFLNRAMAQLKLEKYTQAADDCSSALLLAPNNVKALWRRGVARFHLGQLQDAKADFEAGLRIEPTNKVLQEELDKVCARMWEVKENKKIKEECEQRVIPKARRLPMVAPENAADFERMWREYRSSPGDIYRLLKMVDISDLPRLFRASLESEHLTVAVGAVEVAQNKHGDVAFAKEVLAVFPKIARFNLACLFLDSSDKKRIHSILAWLQTKDEDVSELSKIYG